MGTDTETQGPRKQLTPQRRLRLQKMRIGRGTLRRRSPPRKNSQEIGRIFTRKILGRGFVFSSEYPKERPANIRKNPLTDLLTGGGM